MDVGSDIIHCWQLNNLDNKGRNGTRGITLAKAADLGQDIMYVSGVRSDMKEEM